MNPIHLTRAGRCLDNGGRDERVDDTPRYLCMVDVGVRLQPERLRDSGIFFKLIGRAKQKETRLFYDRILKTRPSPCSRRRGMHEDIDTEYLLRIGECRLSFVLFFPSSRRKSNLLLSLFK